jgi:SsrA-binding protein
MRVISPHHMKPKPEQKQERVIAQNRKAWHDYFIDEKYEAGLALQGWEVKALRAGRAQLKEGYVRIEGGQAWLIGAHISPLTQASTHVEANPTRARKLLLHEHELQKLIGATERKGYTLVPLDLHWTRGRAKIEIGLARGKQLHDKRADLKKREDRREAERALKTR